MTGKLRSLERKASMAPIPVNLPNGAHVMASLQGSLNLSSQINLDKVLCVLNFSCNLISAAQLTKELKCIVIFNEDLCVIQDHTLRSPIGVGRLRGGVYYFDEFSPVTTKVNMLGLYNLWHGRLRHPSDQVLSLPYKDLSISRNENKGPCDVCFRAKQRRTPFAVSESHEKELFGLIHCDI